MPTIGIDYTPAYEQGGGIGRYVRELVRSLLEQPSSIDYRLFVSGAIARNLPKLSNNANSQWRTTAIKPKWMARLWHRAHLPIPIEMFVGHVDIFHATDFVLPPTLPRTRTLLTVHDLSFIRVPEAASPSLKAYLDRVVPISAKESDHILADSQATKDDLFDLYRIPDDKVTVLYCGVDDRFRRVEEAGEILTIRKKYSVQHVSYIFAIGTVQPRKNYGRLIESLATLRKRGQDLHLVIAGGKGWLEDAIYETMNRTHMNEYVHFIGFVDEADLPGLYSAATCLAFPSLYEGFGLPILEAMKCGTPVITSNISSLPEVAGDAALIINPYDQDELTDGLEKIIQDKALRETLIKKGYSRVQQFTWETSAKQLISIYEGLLS